MGTILVSGSVRITDDTGVVYTKLFSNTISISSFDVQTVVIADAAEDYEVSHPGFSSPTCTIILTDVGSVGRVNFTGGPLNSESSEGYEFANFIMNMGSGISGLGDGMLLANSSGDSATLTIIRTQ